MHENLKYYIAFSSIESFVPISTLMLLRYKGSIKDAWQIDEKEILKSGVLIKQADTFIKERANIDPDYVLNEVLKRGLNVICYEDEDYPELLKEIDSPPICLYVKGDLNRANLKRTLAVVGSRRASTSALESLTRIIKGFKGTDITVVSGLAAGIDACAHTAALKNDISTIAVIGSGHDFQYPSTNRFLYKEIEERGTLISEYYPTFAPLPIRFPRRNRIITGLSYGTLVAEAALRSGALVSARYTLEQNRELMCMPGNLTNPNTEGIFKLLKEGATLCTCYEDILNALEWEIQQPQVNKTNKIKLDEEDQNIFDIIAIEPCPIDKISYKTGIEIGNLLVRLSKMELSGIIKLIDGDKYTVLG